VIADPKTLPLIKSISTRYHGDFVAGPVQVRIRLIVRVDDWSATEVGKKHAIMKKIFYPDDDTTTTELVNAMLAAKYYVNRLSQVHLKFQRLNYFPTTGTITIDGEGRYPKKGPKAFLELLKDRYPRDRDLDKSTEASASHPLSPNHENGASDEEVSGDSSPEDKRSNGDEPPW
jgi:hypothetical protein